MPGDFDVVKERIDLVQLVGEKVPLKRAGRIYKGLCPFHAEKTPSFQVDPDRRTFKCWGCGESGDAFTWLEKQDGLDRGEALRLLAERAGVQLTRRAPEEREHEKRLLSAHETAHFYFRQALRGTPGGKGAGAYLAQRGIDPTTVDRFGLGYAPEIRDGLLVYLRKKGFSDQEAIASGLIIDHERGLVDRFRDRLMVPIRDTNGRIIAFAGRAMRAGQPAKYINSPRTDLFDKSATLFALDVAKAQLRRKSEAVIVEGQFDAISCHQAGLDNVVASMGTALTVQQYMILDRLRLDREAGAKSRAIVAFDGDAPGTASAEKRGRELLRVIYSAPARAGKGELSPGERLPVHVSVLPEGKDPDDLARSDPESLRSILRDAKPVLEFVIDQIRGRSDLASPDGRRRFLAEALPLLAEETDPITRGLYVGMLARLTGLGEEVLRERLAGARHQAGARREGIDRAAGALPVQEPPAKSGDGQQPAPSAQRDLERYLVSQLLQFPEEAARSELDPDDFTDPDHRAIFDLLRAGERPGPRYPAPLAAVAAALGASSPPPMDEDQAVRAIEQVSQRLRDRNLRRRIEEKRAARARGDGDIAGLDAEIDRLTDELTRLMHQRDEGWAPGSPVPEDEDE
ncbi:MAG: DNA primase [Candidatus Limnocylindria bacterium]